MKVLRVFHVALIVFFNVCGGPWGVEEVVAPLGPFVGILSLVLFPLLYCIPIIQMTCKMSSRFPMNGGYSIWVQKAFGDFWGFQESFWSYASGVTDNALYPGFVYQLAEPFVGVQPPLVRYLIKVCIAWIFALPTLYHVNGFTKFMGYCVVIVLIPFIVFVVLACFQEHEPLRLVQTAEVTPEAVRDLTMVLYWNYAGFDCASTFSNEIVDIENTMRKGLYWALLSSILTYLIPVVMGVVVTSDWSVWGSDPGDCSWSCIVTQIGGPYLGYAILLSSTVGALGLYMAELFEDAWQLCGMSEAGLIPQTFSKRHARYGTPIHASMFSILLITILVYFDFTENLVLNNFFNAAGTILEFASYMYFYKFQWSMVLPVLITLYVLYISMVPLTALGLLMGLILYWRVGRVRPLDSQGTYISVNL